MFFKQEIPYNFDQIIFWEILPSSLIIYLMLPSKYSPETKINKCQKRYQNQFILIIVWCTRHNDIINGTL